MANVVLKEKAQKLRKEQGLSISSISRTLSVSKSTVSFWCRNILLSPGQLEDLFIQQKKSAKKGSLLYTEGLRRERIKRENIYKKIGARDVGSLSKRDLFILGLGLYWGEGYKNGNTEVGFTNSDPKMIKLMILWFKKVYGVKDGDFVFRLSINKIHQDRHTKIMHFWTKYLNVQLEYFTKTSFINVVSKKVYKNAETYYGVLRLKVRKGVNLRTRILGAISVL